MTFSRFSYLNLVILIILVDNLKQDVLAIFLFNQDMVHIEKNNQNTTPPYVQNSELLCIILL